MTIEAKVEEWNVYYKAWGRRERFKDLSEKDFSEGVAFALVDICKGNHAQALEVLKSVERSQKMYLGDALGVLERLNGTIKDKAEDDEYGSKDAKMEDEDEDEDEQRNTPPAGHTPREAHPWNWMSAYLRSKYHWE